MRIITGKNRCSHYLSNVNEWRVLEYSPGHYVGGNFSVHACTGHIII